VSFDTTVVKCAECLSRNITVDESRGERFCGDCGVLMEIDMIDPGAEWRYFPENGKDQSRVGAPATMLYSDKGLSTDIHWADRDYAGRKISPKSRSQFYRMRRWQQRSRMHKTLQRNLQLALSYADKYCQKLELGRPVRERVATVYRKTLEQNLGRGRSIENVVASCLYLVNQEMQLARTLDEISMVTKISNKDISRIQREIKRKLKIRTPLQKPEDYISGFANKLELDQKVINEAIRICALAEKREMTHGKSPTGVAAAILYIATNTAGQSRTQREIAEVSNVTEVTIRNRYKELVRVLDIHFEV